MFHDVTACNCYLSPLLFVYSCKQGTSAKASMLSLSFTCMNNDFYQSINQSQTWTERLTCRFRSMCWVEYFLAHWQAAFSFQVEKIKWMNHLNNIHYVLVLSILSPCWRGLKLEYFSEMFQYWSDISTLPPTNSDQKNLEAPRNKYISKCHIMICFLWLKRQTE